MTLNITVVFKSIFRNEFSSVRFPRYLFTYRYIFRMHFFECSKRAERTRNRPIKNASGLTVMPFSGHVRPSVVAHALLEMHIVSVFIVHARGILYWPETFSDDFSRSSKAQKKRAQFRSHHLLGRFNFSSVIFLVEVKYDFFFNK